MNRLLALAMGLLAASLLALPHLSTQVHVAAYAVVMGLAGGFVIVIFFSFWSRAWAHALGKSQGLRSTTVVASRWPLLLAECLADGSTPPCSTCAVVCCADWAPGSLETPEAIDAAVTAYQEGSALS